jgi:hypothetical protein
MGDDIQQPADLGLKAVAFFLHHATSQLKSLRDIGL